MKKKSEPSFIEIIEDSYLSSTVRQDSFEMARDRGRGC